MPRKHKPRTIKKYAPKVRKLLKIDEEIKARYKKRDEIFDELLSKLQPGDRVPLDSGKFARLKDNFEGKNKVYRAHGISRLEFEVVEA